MLSPILAFTADEAWEFIPGRGAVWSVHLATWAPGALHRSEAEQTAWRHLFEIRDLVLPELEKERQAKKIGKALEARVVITGSNPMLVAGKAHLEALRELLNVSQLEVHHQPDGLEVSIEVGRALGQKCERCWHWEEDVGEEPQHPTLCGRCVEAVTASGLKS
jgi:isoleucyl-tRNA synthetase